ncbi:SMP-30/gluconolactonase/LRE family protein [Hyphococcus lacteus]|uniref:SMP-30/gluconolactonase/LRE family protein n=1 Tax=Hyphococcus lacteus TaxID=3143536 RepID=A0ABV3Z7D4_9PROT
MNQNDFSRRTALKLGTGGVAAVMIGNSHASDPDYPIVGGVTSLDPISDRLVDPNAKVEKILDGFIWSEGPVWVGGPDGYLLVSDVRGNVIRKWSATSGGSDWLRPSGYAGGDNPDLREPGTNGLLLARDGLVVADCGNRAIARIDLATKKKEMLCTHFGGKRFNSPNDLVLAGDGSIYFTDPPWGLSGTEKSPVRELDYTGVFRLDTNNNVHLIDDSVSPNGIGLSVNGDTLYATDKSGWVSWDIRESSNPGKRKTFISREGSGIKGGDGFKVDSDGFIWASSRDGISVFTSAGKRVCVISSDDVISNCEIGADGYLYMTSNHAIVRVKVHAKKHLL